jgi:two-component system, OmpR family, sensor histidine kinase VicK
MKSFNEFFGTILAFWLTQPIMTLTRVATAIAAGDYSQKASISLHNEIGQLANAFNMMTQKLQTMMVSRSSTSKGLSITADHLQSSHLG